MREEAGRRKANILLVSVDNHDDRGAGSEGISIGEERFTPAEACGVFKEVGRMMDVDLVLTLNHFGYSNRAAFAMARGASVPGVACFGFGGGVLHGTKRVGLPLRNARWKVALSSFSVYRLARALFRAKGEWSLLLLWALFRRKDVEVGADAGSLGDGLDEEAFKADEAVGDEDFGEGKVVLAFQPAVREWLDRFKIGDIFRDLSGDGAFRVLAEGRVRDFGAWASGGMATWSSETEEEQVEGGEEEEEEETEDERRYGQWEQVILRLLERSPREGWPRTAEDIYIRGFEPIPDALRGRLAELRALFNEKFGELEYSVQHRKGLHFVYEQVMAEVDGDWEKALDIIGGALSASDINNGD
jgi:hypothetical protein